MSEPEVLKEVPLSLKLLVRIIMRCFYGDEHAVVMDKLIHHPCIKEEDLLELLRFERKQLRAVITTLKNEKFVRARMKLETDKDSGQTTRHHYYFISYSMFVNVVKYRLHHMQRKIETDERDATNRASFSCPDCMKKFTDLEVDQLLDIASGCLRCTYCHSELTEELSVHAAGQTDTRSLMAKFNDQIEPIYALLRQVEDIRLSNDILEPEPTDYKPARSGSSQYSADSRANVWSGELSKNVAGFGYSEKQVTISVDSAGSAGGSRAEVKPVKEVPLWMSRSTVDSAEDSDRPLQQTQVNVSGWTETSHDVSSADKDDIMRTLLSHEKKSSAAAAAVGGGASTQSSSSDSDDDEFTSGGVVGELEPVMDSDGDADASSDAEMMSMQSVLVTVGNESVPFSDVTDELVARMTAVEKAEYIRLGQQLYDQFNH